LEEWGRANDGRGVVVTECGEAARLYLKEALVYVGEKRNDEAEGEAVHCREGW